MFLVRWATVVFLLLISLSTWVPHIRIAGVGPDLLLGVVFLLALRKGPVWGAWAGFVVGLLAGVEQPSALGAESMALALAGLVVGRASASVDRGNPIVLVILLFCAALIAETMRVIWMAGGNPGSILLLWLRWALPGSLYTTLVLPLLAWAAAAVLGLRGWLAGAA